MPPHLRTAGVDERSRLFGAMGPGAGVRGKQVNAKKATCYMTSMTAKWDRAKSFRMGYNWFAK